jgi:hypothetical protein
MTTIVYDHNAQLIACDSRRSSNGLIKTDSAIKYRYSGANLFFMCGFTCDMAKLIEAYNGKEVEACESHALVVSDGIVKLCGIEDGKFWIEPVDHNESIGSGSSFALAALDFGKSAKEAVEYAITRDCYSGGKVHVYDIKSARFLDGTA